MSDISIISQLQIIFRTVFENEKIVLTETTSAKDIQNWDSMHHILLITEIEGDFGIDFDLDDLIAINNVGDIVSAITAKTATK